MKLKGVPGHRSAARLRAHAAQIDFVVRLDEREVKNRFADGLPDPVDVAEYVVYPRRADWTYRGVPMHTAIVDTEGQAGAYCYNEHMYGAYADAEDMASLYQKRPRSESAFRGVDRVKLIMDVLTCPVRDGGAGLPLDKLVAAGVVLAAFPLADADELRALEGRWITMWAWPWRQPHQRIVDYFGEKIGFYFLFLGHYATFFLGAAAVGVAVFIHTVVADEHQNAASIPYFCVPPPASVRPREGGTSRTNHRRSS